MDKDGIQVITVCHKHILHVAEELHGCENIHSWISLMVT